MSKIMKGNKVLTSEPVIAEVIYTNQLINAEETARQTQETTRQTQETNRVNAEQSRIDAETARQTNTTTAITNANTATTNANNIATQLTNETLIIWKPYVTTYDNIATTYPTPELGWTTIARDTGIRWRYNETEWVNIGVEPTDKVGDLTQLPTTDKTNAVNSIKELNTQLAASVKYVNVVAFGALNNDTEPTATTQAIINAITSATDEDTIYIPSGTFAISDTITFPSDKKLHFKCDGKIKFYGTRDRAVFHFIRPIGRKIEFIGELSDQIGTWHGWTSESYVGIIFENAYRCEINITQVRNFTVGIRLLTSGGINNGFFFNTFKIKQLMDNKTQLEVYQKDVGSWFNSNIFHDIFFTLSQVGTEFQTATVDRYCIKQTFENNTITADSNIFYNVRFDIGNTLGGTYTALFLQRAWAWKFIKYRVELVAGTNVKFANLDLSANQVYELEFDPVFESYTAFDNIKVNLLNATQGTRTYNQIYKKTGALGNSELLLIYEDKNWHERYRKPTTDYNMIDRLYRYRIDGTTFTTTYETESEYSTADRLIENGITIGAYNMGVLYLKNFTVGDTIKIVLKTAVAVGTPQISIKAWDTSDVLIDNNEVNVSDILYKAISADNMYWDSTNKRLAQSNTKSIQTITINRSEVKTVAILFAGGLNGIEIFSSRNEISVLRSIVSSNRNNFPHHVLSSIPTLKTDGKFLVGEIYYNSNTVTGQDIGWQLLDSTFSGSGTLAWKSLGKY